MDGVAYAEVAVGLVNAELTDLAALEMHLAHRARLPAVCGGSDLSALRQFQQELRPVFEAVDAAAPELAVGLLNELLSRHPLRPWISDHEPGRLHLHVAPTSSSVAETVVAESLLGLATVCCDLGVTRLGVCQASGCTRAYLDVSPNGSRRYCSERCSSRANVAAYRARQRALVTSDAHA
jgi:predicted RNA-binding Zn ribbon-like protein